MKTNIQDKTSIVNSVFSRVHKKYDLMNDIMSFGIHRIWKNKLIECVEKYRLDYEISTTRGVPLRRTYTCPFFEAGPKGYY